MLGRAGSLGLNKGIRERQLVSGWTRENKGNLVDRGGKTGGRGRLVPMVWTSGSR